VAALIPAVVFSAELPLLFDQRGNGASVAQSSIAKRIVGVPKDLVVGFSFPGELIGTIVAALLVLIGLVCLATRVPDHERRRALISGTVALFAVVAPIVLAGGGADYVIARNAIVAVVPAAVCLGGGYAANRSALVTGAALCALSLAIAVSVSIGSTHAPRALVLTPDIDAVLWRIYLPSARELDDRPALVREIVVAGLATQGGFSSHRLKPPSATPRPAPHGFKLVDARLTPTFALIRYRAVVPRPPRLSPLELQRLALAPGAIALFLQHP
jgi:hypothetical protein